MVNNLEFKGVSSEDEALMIVRVEPTIITSFPEILLTENVVYEAVIRDSKVYDLVDKIFFTENLVGRLILENPEVALDKVDHNKVKPHHLKTLVEKDGLALQYLTPSMLTNQLCCLAIEQNVKAHEFVPKHLRDEKYINQLIKKSPDYAGRIDVAKRDSKILKDLVEEYPFIICYMSMTDRTKEVCETVLADDIHWIQYFPEFIYNDPDILKMMAENEYFSQPKGEFESCLVRKSLAKYLFNENKDIYKYLPKSIIDFDIALEAVKHDYRNVLITPLALRINGKLWEEALAQKPELYKQIPLEEQSDMVRIFITRTKAKINNKSFEESLNNKG